MEILELDTHGEVEPDLRAGFSCDIVLANFDEVLAGPQQMRNSALWQKALLTPRDGGYILVAPRPVPREVSQMKAVPTPGAIVVPTRQSGRVTWDLLADVRAWAALIEHVRQLPIVDRPVRLWAQVHSAGVQEVSERLERDGIDLDKGWIPAVAGGTVDYWNTKIGMRALLSSDDSVANLLPSATTCMTIPDVVGVVASSPLRGYVVKPDRGLGGVGVVVFPPEVERTRESTVERLRHTIQHVTGRSDEAGDDEGPKAYADVSGPFIVEELMGFPETNRSPSVDVLVGELGSATCIGIVLQRLRDGVGYEGAESVRSTAPEWAEIACRVGQVVGRRGYRGLCNVDLVVTEDGAVFIAELNLRQSAPLDQLLTMTRLFGTEWARTLTFRSWECFEGSFEAINTAATRIASSSGAHIVPLLPVHPNGTCLMVVAPSLIIVSAAVNGMRKVLDG